MLTTRARVRCLLRGSGYRATPLEPLEALEPRRLFATVVWDGGAGGMGFDWHVPTNWVGDQLPGENDDALIATAAFVRISQPTVVRSVTSFVTMLIDGPEGGSLSVSAASSSSNLVLTGELTGAGDFTIDGFLNWSAGAMRGAGRTILPNLSLATISGDAGVILARTLRNSGSVSIGAPSLSLSSGAQAGAIENLVNGQIEFFATTIVSSSQTASISNAGTLRKTGVGIVTIGGLAGATVVLSNGGTIDQQGGVIAVDPATTIFANTGTISVGATALLSTGAIDGLTGAVNVAAGGSLSADRVAQASLTVNGLAAFRANGSPNNVSRLNQLSVGGTLDLNDNDLILDYPAGGPSPLVAVRDAIRSARGSGTWTGPGITSSAAKNATPQIRMLGVMEGSAFHAVNGPGALFNGRVVDDSSVLIKFTYYGDSDFNGRINFDDYSRLDAGFLNGFSGWENGDSNLDGVINFDDYSLIDQAFLGQSARA